MLALGLCATSSVPAQSEVLLQTANTILVVAAAESGPIVKRLGVPGQPPWTNRAGEVLPDHVEMDGQHFPLAWKFAPQESKSDQHRIVFVYETSSPRLRLTWEWRLPVD